MYQLSRLFLRLAVALVLYDAVLAVILTIQQLPPEKQGPAVAIIVAVIMAGALASRKHRRRLLSAFGTASWASVADLARAGMLNAKRGLILGRVRSDGTPFGQAVGALLNTRLGAKDACREFFDAINRSKRKQGRLVRLPQAINSMVVAPVGAGKSTGLVIPFLLTCEESCVVVDFKGELSSITAEHRRRMGHKIVILDPFSVAAPKLKRRPDSFNALDFIAADDPQALDKCRDLAESVVIRTGEEKDPHWNDSAEAVIAAIIAVVVMYGQKDNGTRSLQYVRDILAHPQKFEMAKKLMLEHGGMLARWGGQLAHLRGDEFASVMSTCHRHLRFLDTPAIAESTGSSSFDPAMLRDGKMTVYLVLPAEHMRAQSALLRKWIGSMFRVIIEGGLQEIKKIHYILDEAAALGHMSQLDDAVDKYRGYGIRLQFYYQSLGQLKKCWPNDQGQTLLSNTSKIFFGCNDYQTAEFLSKSLGNETIIVDSGGTNSGWSRNQSTSSGQGYSQSSGTSTSGGSNSNWQQQTRELLKPDEVMQLDPRIAITLTPGVRPLWTRLIRYYEEKELFRPHHWWTRMIAACRTIFVSAVLLVIAASAATVFTIALGDAAESQHKQQRIAPTIQYQAPPQYIPPPAPRRN
jgi:type IV secretion system protein VirD4